MKFNVKDIITACHYNRISFEYLAKKVGIDNIYNLSSESYFVDLLDSEKIAICKELNTVMAYFYGYISDELLFEGKLTLDKYKEAADAYKLDEYFESLGLDWWVKNKTIPEIDDTLFKASDDPLTRVELNSIITFLSNSKGLGVPVSILPANEAIYISLVKNHPLRLKDIKFQTEAINIAAVTEFAHAIEFVKKQTEKIALAAVTKNGLVLEFVEPRFHTEAVVKAAIRQNPLAFQYSALKTEDICLFAVEANGINYEFVPKGFRNHNLKLKSLRSNGWAIKFFESQTEEYALEAVLQHPEACLYIDEDIRKKNQLISLIYSHVIQRHTFLTKYANPVEA